MLIKGLPPHALVRTPAGERGREPWTAYHELLAQVIEITSVTAAGHQIKKPIKVPRPDQKADPGEPQREVRTTRDAPGANPYRSAIAVLGGAKPSRRRELLTDQHDHDENGEQTA